MLMNILNKLSTKVQNLLTLFFKLRFEFKRLDVRCKERFRSLICYEKISLIVSYLMN